MKKKSSACNFCFHNTTETKDAVLFRSSDQKTYICGDCVVNMVNAAMVDWGEMVWGKKHVGKKKDGTQIQSH
jgi:hypothetical protein